MNGQRPLRMRMSLDVLQHLGLNLYSNVPSVLSEVVANAWDADAENVYVTLDVDNGCITIEDDGTGMTRDDVIDRFLLVGYQRRSQQPGLTPKGRLPMGRKGIGKLSLFSIANEIRVETVREGQTTALRMNLDAVKEAIERNQDQYEPEELQAVECSLKQGTRIVLRELRKRQTIRTSEGLRKRLARRFSIIGPSHGFAISVNGAPIAPQDRGFHRHLQYIWTYGDQSEILPLCTSLEGCHRRKPEILVSGGPDLTVDGWLGTVHESRQLRDDHGENLNRIAVFVRGKMAQEDLLGDFTERGIYSSYLIGELQVDGLDTASGLDADRDEDSATSSRQRILEDDPRYVALKDFVRAELKFLQSRWSDLRVSSGSRSAQEIPEVRCWIEGLPKQLGERANRWLGKLNRINVEEPSERIQLIKHAVLAFEFFRWNENLDNLDAIGDENLEAVIRMFQESDSLEATLYGQIVQQRVAVIRALQEKVDQNAKERVIQAYIFDHLWLLDPHWERVEASEVMEKRVGALFDRVDAALPARESKARLDIRYRKTAGKHVIIELKRPERSVSVHDLAKQIEKYRTGMLKILEGAGIRHEPVEFVCLLGKPPIEWDNPDGKDTVATVLGAYNARYVNYDELLENAFRAYSDYLKRADAVDRLGSVISAINNYAQD